MQSMSNEEFNDDGIRITSTTPINIKETVPLIRQPSRKWICLCRSVKKKNIHKSKRIFRLSR